MTLIVQGNSSNSSSFYNSNSTSTWKFHVFLSFFGQDTRRNFTDHLYNALLEAGIVTFRDDEGIEKGEVISQQLVKAIEDSLVAIVVLSKNFASSTWCLDELQKILKARNELGREVFPIFYDIDPSDVRHQRGNFAQALGKHEERFKERKEKVQRWRDALTEVANLSGWDSNGWHETKIIGNIVGAIWTKLWSKLPSYNDNLVGIGMRMVKMNSLLRIGVDDVRFIGIWGMGGIGKTTLARFVFERIFHQFEICCFLADVRENSERDGQVHLQRKLLSHLKISSMAIEDTYQGKKLIKNLFCTRKVLLVLDDANDRSQLENLAESPTWFGVGSRVIITTRDMHLLKSHGVYGTIEIEIMKEDESLQLLSKEAFDKDQPNEGYLELSKSIVQYAGGLPLALKVLGSFLCGRSVLEWEDALDKLKQIPNNSIVHILKISYDGLDPEEKTIFLDIACFFKGWRKDEVTQILKNCGLHATIGLSRLIEKSLLIVRNGQDGNHFLEMHDLLQELGRSIVLQESNNCCKRSRLWTLEDIDQVLESNMGTEATQGMVLSLHESHEVQWDPEAFSKMCDLSLFIVSNNQRSETSNELNLPRGVKCLSTALKVVHWWGYPLKTLPLETPLEKLVDLKMQYSKVKQLWNGTHCLGKLKLIDLSYSKCLIETPNFSGVPNLERLILEGCTSLVKVHPSLGELNKLVLLNLRGCRGLKMLPKKLEMYSLTELVLCGCSKVTKLPEFGKSMKDLSLLDLEDTAIAELPDSLGFLIGLVTLNLKGCKNLVCLPRTFHNLKYLKTLNIFGSSKFFKLPENLDENGALELLDVGETSITQVPPSIAQLRNLKTLSFYGCKGSACNSSLGLPHIFWRMFGWYPLPMDLVLPPLSSLTSLTHLNLSYCCLSDGSIPGDFGCLSSLQNLELRGNNFVNLPAACISNLLQLQFLDLRCCPRLKSLPNLPPSLIRLDAGDCASIEHLSDQQLWSNFSLLDHQRRCRTNNLHIIYQDALGKKRKRSSFPREDFIALIPGSEIPSWFLNKNDGYLNEDKEVLTIKVEIPECCGASEWSRIAICLVLDDLLDCSTEIDDPSASFVKPFIWWYACDRNAPQFRTLTPGWGHAINVEGDKPHLCLMFLNYNDEKRWPYPRGNGNDISIYICIVNPPSWKRCHAKITKWGWRVLLCKEDMQELYKTNGFNQLSLAEACTNELRIDPMCQNADKKKKKKIIVS